MGWTGGKGKRMRGMEERMRMVRTEGMEEERNRRGNWMKKGRKYT